MPGEPSPSFVEGIRNYVLTSDLAQYCLPSASRDVSRKFAWANSICFFFLLIGIIGIKEPEAIPSASTEVIDAVPVVFTPPEEQPKVEPEIQPDEPEPQPATALDTPVIATVVAPESTAAFPVPVEGPVILAPSARYASAPPPKPASRPKPTEFRPGKDDGGSYPHWDYPRLALQRSYQGKGMLYVIVDANGSLVSVEIKDSTGYDMLDNHVEKWVKNKWRWPPGQTRHFLVPFEFQIK